MKVMAHFLQLLFLLLCVIMSISAGAIGDYEVTSRDFPFVDPSRCRQADFCGLSSEWDLKFGRPIPATAYFPGNATQSIDVNEPMPVLVFASLRTSVSTFDSLLSAVSSAGVVCIWVHCENEQSAMDYVRDALRVAFDMFYENDNAHSVFFERLSGKIVLAGFKKMADLILWSHHFEHFVHSAVVGIVSISPSLHRDPELLSKARQLGIDTMVVAGTSDPRPPVSNARAIYTQLRAAKREHNGVCKLYVEIVGGNECFFTDLDPDLTDAGSEHSNSSRCLSKQSESPYYRGGDIGMSHLHQLNTHSAPLLLRFVQFVTNVTDGSAQAMQQYIIDERDTTGELQFLQSCYVGDTLYAHDQPLPTNTELREYRRVL